MTRYLVKMKPIGSFFFGNDRTFSFKAESKKNDRLKFNIVKSRCFPQQTSILGMLRKEVLIKLKLIQHDWNYNNKRKIDKLIGAKSFDFNSINEFGCIKKISPIFIAIEKGDNIDYLMRIPMDHRIGKNLNKYTPLSISPNKIKCSYGNDIEKNLYLPMDFESKEGISEDFIYINSDMSILKKDDIFKKECNIGIKINKRTRVTEEECLFRIERYKFKDETKERKEFVFTVDIDEKVCESKYISNINFDNYSNIVNLGGENSYFNISFKKVDDNYKFINKINISESNSLKRIILLSDTYIKKEYYEKLCDYSIANLISFRNMTTDYEKTSQYERVKKIQEKYYFIEKGSVLYVNEDENNYKKLKEAICKNKNLRNIGYNQFIGEEN